MLEPLPRSNLHVSTDQRRAIPLPLTLAHLTEEFLRLADLLTELDPSDEEGLALVQRQLDQSATDIRTKASSIAAVIREFEAPADIAQSEADRISAHARAAKSRAVWLREYLLNHLQALGVDRIQTPTALIVIRASPPTAEVLDEDQLPDAFERVVRSIDRAGLRKALLGGEVIPGARLARGTHLSIR